MPPSTQTRALDPFLRYLMSSWTSQLPVIKPHATVRPIKILENRSPAPLRKRITPLTNRAENIFLRCIREHCIKFFIGFQQSEHKFLSYIVSKLNVYRSNDCFKEPVSLVQPNTPNGAFCELFFYKILGELYVLVHGFLFAFFTANLFRIQSM